MGLWHQDEVDATAGGNTTLLGVQAVESYVEGNQRRRTGCVNCHCWALQPKAVGDAPRRHTALHCICKMRCSLLCDLLGWFCRPNRSYVFVLLGKLEAGCLAVYDGPIWNEQQSCWIVLVRQRLFVSLHYASLMANRILGIGTTCCDETG